MQLTNLKNVALNTSNF